MTTERYVYKIHPVYSHTQKITLRQIHELDYEYNTITNQQKLRQDNRKRLIIIDQQTEIWTKQDTYDNKQSPCHRDNHLQQQQQQQHTQRHELPTGCDGT